MPLFFACERVTEPVKKLTATKIKEILDHPRNYENKEITIYGTVTGWASLLLVKYFEIQDDTGSIKVITKRVLPGQAPAREKSSKSQAIWSPSRLVQSDG